MTSFLKVLTGQRDVIFQQTQTAKKRVVGGRRHHFQEPNDNQVIINAKLLDFKLKLLPTVVRFKEYILKFM